MIHLTKTPKPHVLVVHEQEWTKTILDKKAAAEPLTLTEKTRYRHAEIKAALVVETHGKCAYCESKFRHVHHGDVEHIHPKSLAPEKTVQWENLTLACEICNQRKSDLDPYLEAIIDPYRDDPSDHMVFVGSLVFSRGTAKGTATKAILDLNRTQLAESRRERLERLMSIYESLQRADVPLAAKVAIYADLKEKECGPSAAYTAMARALVAQMEGSIPIEVQG